MLIQSFQVEGFANFSRPVLLRPLEQINVVYGPNNCGKSNLLRALELYLRLLGAGETVTRSQSQTLERDGSGLARLIEQGLPPGEPHPMRFEAAWEIRPDDLARYDLQADTPCSRIETVLEVRPAARSFELRVERWALQGKDVAVMDRVREAPMVGFALQLRRLLADARPFQFDQPVPPVAFLGAASEETFPQALRDGLFDARQSSHPEQRRRWRLFTTLGASLQPELGPGSWETTFDRATGRAGLVYLQGQRMLPLSECGAGLQRAAALLAEISLAQEPILCFEEPEWRLSPGLQQRWLEQLRRAVETGLGPRQAFLTTHSPTLAAGGTPFALEVRDGAPAAEQRVWSLAAAAATPDATRPQAGPVNAAGTPEAPADLDGLIGLVEDLAEIDPSQLLESS